MGWRPSTGKGSIPRRLDLIYRSNMRSARAAGQWQRIQETKQFFPYLLYSLGPSQVHRDQHVAWAGTILPADDPWWNTNFPPNGWGCKCWVRQVSSAERERLISAGKAHGSRVQTTAPPVEWRDWKNPATGRTLRVPKGISPGWEWNAGKDRMLGVRRAFAEHIERILAPICPPGFMARTRRRAVDARCYIKPNKQAAVSRQIIKTYLAGPGFAHWIKSMTTSKEIAGEVAVATLGGALVKKFDVRSRRLILPANLARKIWLKHSLRRGGTRARRLKLDHFQEIQRMIDTLPATWDKKNKSWRLVRRPRDGEQSGYLLAIRADRDDPTRAVVVSFFRVSDASAIARGGQ